MLQLHGEPFTTGVSSYVEEDPSFGSEQTSIHVNILLHGSAKISTTARLDPATPWVVLNAEFNKQIEFSVESDLVQLRTLAGPMSGKLARCPITLTAQDGDALEIDATLFVCDEWQRENFLGYSGFLERIRFAVDPRFRKFYFGPQVS